MCEHRVAPKNGRYQVRVELFTLPPAELEGEDGCLPVIQAIGARNIGLMVSIDVAASPTCWTSPGPVGSRLGAGW